MDANVVDRPNVRKFGKSLSELLKSESETGPLFLHEGPGQTSRSKDIHPEFTFNILLVMLAMTEHVMREEFSLVD